MTVYNSKAILIPTAVNIHHRNEQCRWVESPFYDIETILASALIYQERVYILKVVCDVKR